MRQRLTWLVLFFVLGGCDLQEDEKKGQELFADKDVMGGAGDASCFPEAETWLLIRNWDDIENSYQECLEQFPAPCSPEDAGCAAGVASCYYEFALMVNNRPNRMCEARPFIIEDLPGLDPVIRPAVQVDTDKDGLSDYAEFLIRFNPCTAYTFGCEADGDVDADGDGKPNRVDNSPACHDSDQSCR